ncbi:MAG: cupredoxin domain-containing protein [Methylocella sp.]
MRLRQSGALVQVTVLLAVLTRLAQMPATAGEAITLHTSIKDHRFQPTELKASANTPITLVVRNLDATPEEFESRTLRVEKVVAGNSEITIQLRPLVPGRYRFYGDFNQATAQGTLIAE